MSVVSASDRRGRKGELIKISYERTGEMVTGDEGEKENARVHGWLGAAARTLMKSNIQNPSVSRRART